MNSLLSKSFAVAVGLASALALTPAVAAPAIHLAPGSVPDTGSRVIQVQTPGSPQTGADFYHRGSGGYRYHGGYHNRRHWHHRRHHHRHGRYYYRHRHHDNGAAIVGGLITGAIIGGIAANAMGNGGGGSAHVRWCYNRYRSYRASDNTYQPYHGQRRQCVSPY